MTSKITLVIGKLLRKAEATDSVAEADALLAKAQSLATRHSIDLALARLAQVEREAREQVEEREVAIGRPRQPHLVLRRRLFAAIAEVNDVTVLLRGTEACLHPIGFTSDLDVVEAIYRSLERQMRRGAEEWLRLEGTTLHPRTARGQFYEGFVSRVHARLVAARDAELWPEGQVVRSHRFGQKVGAQELSSTAVALRAKQKEVDDFIAAKYQRVGRRTTRVRGASDPAQARAQLAGRAAADRANLAGQARLTSAE